VTTWTQEEFEAMCLADDEIDEEFNLTLGEIDDSREHDAEVLDGQLDFRDLHAKMYQRAYNSRYYEQHREELNRRCRERYAANREAERERSRSWRENNAEYSSLWQKAYYEQHREDIRRKKREYYLAHREEILVKRKSRR